MIFQVLFVYQLKGHEVYIKGASCRTRLCTLVPAAWLMALQALYFF